MAVPCSSTATLYRAGVELFDESLNARTLSKLSREIGRAARCDMQEGARKVPMPSARTFEGVYEEEATIFAVARVPCTDWAVVTFETRRLVDAQAVKPALHAIIVWASLTLIPYFIWIFAVLWWGRRAWIWLWPDPATVKKKAYKTVAFALLGAALIATLLIEIGSPFKALILSALASFAAFGWLGWVHYKQAAGQRLNKPLDQKTERWFTLFTVMVLIMISAVPVAALAADARAYFAQVAAAQTYSAGQEAKEGQIRLQNAIARMEGVETQTTEFEPAAARRCDDCPHYFTQWLRQGAGFDQGLEPLLAYPTHWFLALPYIDLNERVVMVSLTIILALILGLALSATMRGLFGFRVPLEAVEYPRLPVKETQDGWVLEDKLPPRDFSSFVAGQKHMQALTRNAVVIDMKEMGRREVKLPAPNHKIALVLVTNLGLLLGDKDKRRKRSICSNASSEAGRAHQTIALPY